jgi:RNA polymerase sigma factor (sigma-70 family)
LDELNEIEALQNGSQKAFSLLTSNYSAKVYNLSFSILQNQEDAEDVTQEVFTTVFLSINQFKGDSKLSTWIYRITVNKCQELIRKRSRKKRFGIFTTYDKMETAPSSSIKANFVHPGIELENQERSAILFGAINCLPENQKIAFTMHKIEGIPYEEIASIMETSLSSVESLIFRARQNLKQALASYYEENER